MEGNKYIKERYNLHNTPEVRSAVRREEAISDEKVPQKPLEQIQVYFDRFREITERENPEERERGIRALKEVLYRDNIISVDDIPESYLKAQERTAVERDGVAFTELDRQKAIEAALADQQESLDQWVDYLTGPNADYPDWAKYWFMRSVLSMGPYDTEKHSYSSRSKATTKGFPEINSEALSLVYDVMESKLKGETVENPVKLIPNANNPDEQKRFTDEQFQQLLTTENFSKYYAFAMEYGGADNSELFPITEGEWKTFSRGSSSDEMRESLQGQGTNWCIAGKGLADTYIGRGDIHIFYSQNKLGEPVIPRLCIRMSGDKIAEVRGVEKGQDVDRYITPVIEEKMSEFGPEGEPYKKRAVDAQRLRTVQEKITSSQELAAEDLRFLYEFDSPVQTFAQHQGLELRELLTARSPKEDFAKIFGTTDDIEIAKNLLEEGRYNLLVKNLADFSELNTEIAEGLIENSQASVVFSHYDVFTDVDEVRLVEKLFSSRNQYIVAENLAVFQMPLAADVAEKLVEQKYAGKVLSNLDCFVGVDLVSMAEKLAETEQYSTFISHKELFSEESQMLVFEHMAKDPKGLAEKLHAVRPLKKEMALMLIEAGYAKEVFENLRNISSQEQNSVMSELLVQEDLEMDLSRHKYAIKDLGAENMQKLIERGQAEGILEYLSNKFEGGSGLSFNVAYSLGAEGYGERLPFVIKHFSPDSHMQIAQMLVEDGELEKLFSAINKFENIDTSALADEAFGAGQEVVLANNLDKFSGLTPRHADELIESGFGKEVARNLKSFEGLDFQKIADSLIAIDGLDSVSSNLHNFKNLNQETFEALSGAGHALYAVYNVDSFNIVDYGRFAKTLVASGRGEFIGENIGKFEEKMGQEALAKLLLEVGDPMMALTMKGVDRAKAVEYLSGEQESLVMLESLENKFNELLGEKPLLDFREQATSGMWGESDVAELSVFTSNAEAVFDDVIKIMNEEGRDAAVIQRYEKLKAGIDKLQQILSMAVLKQAA